MKVTCFITLTETRCVTGVQSERLLLGDGEEVKTINPINFKVYWVVVKEFSLVEVVVASFVWAMQANWLFWMQHLHHGCLGTPRDPRQDED